MYRLHIDLPLGVEQERAIARAKQIVEAIRENLHADNLVAPGDMMQYRLLEDTDRNPNNYLLINENGHCAKKKCKIEF